MVTPPAGFAIEIKGLQKSYGDWPVLWDLDLTVEWGSFLVLFGSNGAGKTTLLSLLSTQARPEAGTIRIAGYDCLRHAGAARRRLGVVGHRSFLYDDLTCQENLQFYARLFGLKNIRQRASSVLSRVGLASRAQQRVRTLSHGMQKRLSIARAILHQPGLLLLDEPEAGLDQDSVAMLYDLLREWTGGGGSVVMTTHNLELGIAWADKVAVLTEGRIRYLEPNSDGGISDVRQMLADSGRRRESGTTEAME